MQKLTGVILVKMGVTVVWVAVLFLPHTWQKCLGFPPEEQNAVFIRLLGMAYAALLGGYAFGFFAIREKIYPRGVVWTGIVSNGGACLLLGVFQSTWCAWPNPGPALMWASLAATGLIAAGLIAFGPFGRFATAASEIVSRK